MNWYLIDYQRQHYLIFETVTTSCHIAVQCKSSSAYTTGECSISRTNKLVTYNSTVPLDLVTSLPYLIPELVTHYVHFTAFLNGGLEIRENVSVELMLETIGKVN